jgi:hypothetical protein
MSMAGISMAVKDYAYRGYGFLSFGPEGLVIVRDAYKKSLGFYSLTVFHL